MAIFAGNRHLRLKVMLRGPKLWVNLILNVIGVHLRSTGTHFDHNRYIIRIFILGIFCRSLWSRAKVLDPLYTGVPKIFFRKLLFEFVVSNLFHVLQVGKEIKSKFPKLSPLPSTTRLPENWHVLCAISKLLFALLKNNICIKYLSQELKKSSKIE